MIYLLPFFLLLCSGSKILAQTQFQVIGSETYASAINSSGILVGSLNTSSYWGARGFFYSNGTLSVAPTRYGYGDYNNNDPSWTKSVTVINNNGQWGGIYGTETLAFQFSGTYPTNASHGGERGRVNAINDSGTAVGHNNQLSGARVWTQTGSSSLPLLGGMSPSVIGRSMSSANGINNSGLIVGDSEPYYTSLGLPRKAVYWQSGSIYTIGTLGGEYSSARAVNNNNLIVGTADTLTERHAFSYFNGSLLDLGTLGGNESAAFDVNDNGWVVGKSKTLLGDWAGFVYKDNIMYDLNSWLGPSLRDGWTINEAVAINENGQIAANGTKNGISSALFITIPEPSSLSLMLAGGAVLMAGRRRKF